MLTKFCGPQQGHCVEKARSLKNTGAVGGWVAKLHQDWRVQRSIHLRNESALVTPGFTTFPYEPDDFIRRNLEVDSLDIEGRVLSRLRSDDEDPAIFAHDPHFTFRGCLIQQCRKILPGF
jgi:hypothetical protein